MLDIKTFKSALEQLEERKIPKEKNTRCHSKPWLLLQKRLGKKGQIIRAKFDSRHW